MSPKIALIVCIIFVLVLLRIERKNNPNATLALWIPTVWMLICGSRPVGSWFAPEGAMGARNLAAGNSVNQIVLALLFLSSLWVLLSRGVKLPEIVKDNKWLFLLYAYMGLSVLWSDFPSVAFRRWIKVSITLAMGAIILSEPSPSKAFESALRRCVYVLVPFSLLLIKYIPYLGRQYNRLNGELMWTGVAGQKNGLGLLCAVSIFFLIWSYICKQKSKERIGRGQLFIDSVTLLTAMYLLFGNRSSYSATAIFVLAVGAGQLLVISKWELLARWVGRRLNFLIIVGALAFILASTTLLPVITSVLGRDVSLTGRKDIWSTALSIADGHHWVGAGYGNLVVEEQLYEKHGVLQFHNGYLEIYVYLGIVGILLLFGYLLEFGKGVAKTIRYDLNRGLFGICYLSMLLLYNYTESSFLRVDLTWTLSVFVSFLFSAKSSPIIPRET